DDDDGSNDGSSSASTFRSLLTFGPMISSSIDSCLVDGVGVFASIGDGTLLSSSLTNDLIGDAVDSCLVVGTITRETAEDGACEAEDATRARYACCAAGEKNRTDWSVTKGSSASWC